MTLPIIELKSSKAKARKRWGWWDLESKEQSIEKQKEEIIDEVVSRMVEEVEEVEDNLEPQKETEETTETEEKKRWIKYLSWKWIKKDWWWKWEWETDDDWYAIYRKENPSATMFHIEREWWFWKEGKNEKQYPVWDTTFKRTGENILAYKKDWKLVQVKRTKTPFNLAKRLYETGHAYESKAQKDSD